MYKGYRLIEGTTSEINEMLTNVYGLAVNEYIIIHNLDDDSTKEMRYDGTKLVSLVLPSSKFIKGKNPLQRCALDMLNNPDIYVCGLFGGYGSGKTFLAMQMALYLVEEKGHQSKIVGVREVLGAGKEIGYLPGGKEDKIGDFFSPLSQNLPGGEFQLERLKAQGKLEVQVPFFMKGQTYNDSVMVVDECEDLTKKQIKLIGTRAGENTRIFFSGDFKQSELGEGKDTACVLMANELKGNKHFACIYMEEDVRGEASRMFAHLFE